MSKSPRLLQAFHKVHNGEDLNREEARATFNDIMGGEASQSLMAAFLVALSTKGESVEEISGAVSILREWVAPIKAPDHAIDTCGTGGDGKGTLNVSTAVAIVAAAAGATIAKHGNRNLSSLSGSAQVLAELGINIEAEHKTIERSIANVGVGFMMAPRHHSALRHVGPVRVELGIKTIFNLLGPLANPAGTKKQLVGVYDAKWVRPLAQVMINLGTESAWVVHGLDGLDEISISGPTLVAEYKDRELRTFELDPRAYGFTLSPLSDIRGGDPAHNAKAMKALFEGEASAYRDIVVLNAGAALLVSGEANSLEQGIEQAKAAIDDGKAKEKLSAMVAASHE